MNSTAYTYEDKALIFPTEHIAVISDIHFDYHFSQHKVEQIHKRIHKLINRYDLQTIIFNGDTFNEFPFLEEGITLLNELTSTVEIILLPGNHEEAIGGFQNLDEQFTIQQEVVLTIENTTFAILHGHVLPTVKSDIYVIGHLHPIIEGNRPCAVRMKQQYNNSDVLVLPAFTTHDGQDITVATHNSPLLSETPQFKIEAKF